METLSTLESLSGLIPFAEHLLLAIALTVIFCVIYLWLTPYRELELIQSGQVAPAISLSGALLGFTIALASAITHSVSLLDMGIWALIALCIQGIIFVLMRALLPKLYQGLIDNQPGPALLLASLSIAAGLLNAACMSY